MPSDKAKANKALMATCVACNKPISTESAVSLTGVEDGHQQAVHRMQQMRERRMASAGLRRDAVVPPRVSELPVRAEKFEPAL